MGEHNGAECFIDGRVGKGAPTSVAPGKGCHPKRHGVWQGRAAQPGAACQESAPGRSESRKQRQRMCAASTNLNTMEDALGISGRIPILHCPRCWSTDAMILSAQ
jgi:hypothetical protein